MVQQELTEAQAAELTRDWRSFEDRHRNGDISIIVYEDDTHVVLADMTGHAINELAQNMNMSRMDLSYVMRSKARALCGYDWSQAEAVVYEK